MIIEDNSAGRAFKLSAVTLEANRRNPLNCLCLCDTKDKAPMKYNVFDIFRLFISFGMEKFYISVNCCI